MKPYLVTVAGLRGVEQQIWYDDGGRFVGPPIEAANKLELPERTEPWTLAAALAHARGGRLDGAEG